MGSSSSSFTAADLAAIANIFKQSNAKQITEDNNSSTGFHVIELHSQSAGIGAATLLAGFLLIVFFIWMFKRCGCPCRKHTRVPPLSSPDVSSSATPTTTTASAPTAASSAFQPPTQPPPYSPACYPPSYWSSMALPSTVPLSWPGVQPWPWANGFSGSAFPSLPSLPAPFDLRSDPISGRRAPVPAHQAVPSTVPLCPTNDPSPLPHLLSGPWTRAWTDPNPAPPTNTRTGHMLPRGSSRRSDPRVTIATGSSDRIVEIIDESSRPSSPNGPPSRIRRPNASTSPLQGARYSHLCAEDGTPGSSPRQEPSADRAREILSSPNPQPISGS